MTTRKLMGLAAVVLLAVAVDTTTALAEPQARGVNGTVQTTDTVPGGKGTFAHASDRLYACDQQRDAYDAVARLYRRGTNTVVKTTVDTTPNGRCTVNTRNLTEGMHLDLRVCLRAKGQYKFCSPRRHVIA